MKRIELGELFRRAIDALESEKIPYLVYGGLALPAWGEVRPTEDVDLLVRIREEESTRLMAAFRKAGFKEVARRAANRPIFRYVIPA